jgi:hypothetical protein
VSRELRHVEVTVITEKPENLPIKDGQHMYADDVVDELRTAVQTAVDRWYAERGHELLACEPDVC